MTHCVASLFFVLEQNTTYIWKVCSRHNFRCFFYITMCEKCTGNPNKTAYQELWFWLPYNSVVLKSISQHSSWFFWTAVHLQQADVTLDAFANTSSRYFPWSQLLTQLQGRVVACLILLNPYNPRTWYQFQFHGSYLLLFAPRTVAATAFLFRTQLLYFLH